MQVTPVGSPSFRQKSSLSTAFTKNALILCRNKNKTKTMLIAAVATCRKMSNQWSKLDCLCNFDCAVLWQLRLDEDAAKSKAERVVQNNVKIFYMLLHTADCFCFTSPKPRTLDFFVFMTYWACIAAFLRIEKNSVAIKCSFNGLLLGSIISCVPPSHN